MGTVVLVAVFVIVFNLIAGEVRHNIIGQPSFVKKWARDAAVKAARSACDGFIGPLPADYIARNIAFYAAEAVA